MGTRNTLGDLNNHLFEQLERLNDDSLQGKELYAEIERAKTVASVANKIIANGALILAAKKFTSNKDRVDVDTELPKMLEG